MKLPASFPEDTLFLRVGLGMPVTARFSADEFLSWEDRDAEEPERLTFEDIAGKCKAINQAEFRALVHQAHTCALPALLIRAAKDLQQRREFCADLKAQGLTDHEIRERMKGWRIQHRDDEAETIALRAVAAASRSSRRA